MPPHDIVRVSKRICVIGAGPSGLVAARELRRETHDVVVFEQNSDVGGQWFYIDGEDVLGMGNDEGRVHSSVYSSLRLNLPREIMGYRDFPFLTKKGRDMRRFPGHRELFLYLQDFSEKFHIKELVRFNTRVVYVGMLDNGELGKDSRWIVRTKDQNMSHEEDEEKEVFDAVVVATGQYSKPRLPIIKGIDGWRRRQIHSHVYRVPEPFQNEVVIVVGNSVSGRDVSMELTDVAKDVYLSVKALDQVSQGMSKIISKNPNLHLRPQIEALEEDGRVFFVDGSWVFADTIIYCTGYSYSFPFLDTRGIVMVDDDRVGPLYEHTFPPSLAPSLSFVGIPRKIIGFPFFESQAKWIAELLSGRRTLPSQEDMMKSIKEFYHSRDVSGIPKHNTHDIADLDYCDTYGENVGFPHLEQWKKDLFLSSAKNSQVNLETYRDSYEHDHDLLQIAHQSLHFTQHEDEDHSFA